MQEDVIGGRASFVADDGERENFHRSARALPATRGHAARPTRCDDIAGQRLTSRLCRAPALIAPAPPLKEHQLLAMREKIL
jgi:hypothetical protein